MGKKVLGRYLLTAALFVSGGTWGQAQLSPTQGDVAAFADDVFHLSEVMLHDVTSPPAAARFYAYALLGAYEAALAGTPKIPDIHHKFAATPLLKIPDPPRNYDLLLAAGYALLETGRQLMPSGHLLEERKKELLMRVRTTGKLSERDITQHVRFATALAGQVVQYARTDGYQKLSTFPRYTPRREEGFWYPTPPEYMGAIEPQWETIRPFFLRSATQFAPEKPAPFSKDTASSFYRQMKEVYEVASNLTEEQKLIANFWDCNPFAVTYSGHMAIGLKKISPGGHWIGITGIACREAGISLDSAILVHALVATTLHDAFISCWQEKYSSDRIRPETAINKYLDPAWRPLLQTPPFPEYTSGHSVASAAAAVVLTYLLGDNFGFTDTSEVYFGLPERRFPSFYDAAGEAAVSRLYGGIHFRDACDQGVVQGKKVGRFVVNTLSGTQP